MSIEKGGADDINKETQGIGDVLRYCDVLFTIDELVGLVLGLWTKLRFGYLRSCISCASSPSVAKK